MEVIDASRLQGLVKGLGMRNRIASRIGPSLEYPMIMVIAHLVVQVSFDL